jgi:hypothetical protein
MKKINLFVFILLATTTAFAQKQESTTKLKVFKFNPLGLVTSSLSFGLESFNAEKSKSTVVNFAIRYKTNGNDYFGANFNDLGETIAQYSEYKGVMLGLERRLYVPNMHYFKYWKNSEANMNSIGVYFAPAVRFDYNQNSYDKSYFHTEYNSTSGQPVKYTKITNTGKINYLGIMPAMNLGLQFTLAQHAYIDFQLGGGIRFQTEKAVANTKTNTPNFNSYSNNNAVSEMILKEGVRPSGSITLGLKL